LRAKRKRLLWKAVFFLLVFLIFAGGIVALFYIPRFRINEISVKGIEVLNGKQFNGEIENILNGKLYSIIPYDNFLFIPTKKITDELLQKFPILKKIIIARNFSQKLSVEVEERKPEALWCLTLTDNSVATSTTITTDSCAFVDEKGFIFAPAPFFSGTIFPKFFDEREEPSIIGREMIPEAEFEKLSAFKDLLFKNDINVAKIILQDEGIYEVYSKEGWYVLLNTKNEPNSSFNNLKLVFDTQIKEKRPKLEYIDLRFGKKIFFKYK